MPLLCTPVLHSCLKARMRVILLFQILQPEDFPSSLPPARLSQDFDWFMSKLLKELIKKRCLKSHPELRLMYSKGDGASISYAGKPVTQTQESYIINRK